MGSPAQSIPVMIVGVALGVLCCVLCWCWYRRRKRKAEAMEIIWVDPMEGKRDQPGEVNVDDLDLYLPDSPMSPGDFDPVKKNKKGDRVAPPGIVDHDSDFAFDFDTVQKGKKSGKKLLDSDSEEEDVNWSYILPPGGAFSPAGGDGWDPVKKGESGKRPTLSRGRRRVSGRPDTALTQDSDRRSRTSRWMDMHTRRLESQQGNRNRVEPEGKGKGKGMPMMQGVMNPLLAAQHWMHRPTWLPAAAGGDNALGQTMMGSPMPGGPPFIPGLPVPNSLMAQVCCHLTPNPQSNHPP